MSESPRPQGTAGQTPAIDPTGLNQQSEERSIKKVSLRTIVNALLRLDLESIAWLAGGLAAIVIGAYKLGSVLGPEPVVDSPALAACRQFEGYYQTKAAEAFPAAGVCATPFVSSEAILCDATTKQLVAWEVSTNKIFSTGRRAAGEDCGEHENDRLICTYGSEWSFRGPWPAKRGDVVQLHGARDRRSGLDVCGVSSQLSATEKQDLNVLQENIAKGYENGDCQIKLKGADEIEVTCWYGGDTKHPKTALLTRRR